MNINVTFEQADMALQPQFDEKIQIGTNGVGVTFYPSVSDDGIISWTNDGNLPNPEPVNIRGKDGVDGKDGSPGADGYSPIRGVDYWTEADKAEMVADVIASLPVYEGEVVE